MSRVYPLYVCSAEQALMDNVNNINKTTHRQSTMTQFLHNETMASVPALSQSIASQAQPIFMQQTFPQPIMTVDPALAQMAQLMQENQNLFAENKIKSQQEHAMWNAWQNERNGYNTVIQNLKGMINNQNVAIQQLQQKMQDLENDKSNEIRYRETDDDPELSADSAWARKAIAKSNKNKITTSNKQATKNTRIRNETKAVLKPPPIMIDNVSSFPVLKEILEQRNVNANTYELKSLNNNKVKINAADEKTYLTITGALNSLREAEWYSFENKQNRDIKVMVKDLHHSYKPEAIINDIMIRYKLVAKNVTNKHKWLTAEQKKIRREKGNSEYEPLNMFIVSFDKKTDIEKIYEIKTILNCRVQVEPLRKNQLIPQCKKCQEYGHTQNFCKKSPRCVKCAGKHESKTCNKADRVQPTCYHCKGAHPANYRGCEVFKKILETRKKNSKPKQLPTQPNRAKPQPQPIPVRQQRSQLNSTSSPQLSYNQAVKGNISTPENRMDKLEMMIHLIMQKLNISL